MYKVKNSDKTITPYGGLNLVFNAITAAGIDKFIDEILGYRSISAKYKRSDIVLSLLGMSMAQGSFLSDIEVFKSKFIEQVFNKIPSADTVEYVCDELKVPTIVHHSTNGILHEFNYNQDLNNALVALAVKTKQLPSTIKHILDFDNVVVPTQKLDAKMSYKQELGYHPSIAFIGRLPVHIECHNGNTPARY